MVDEELDREQKAIDEVKAQINKIDFKAIIKSARSPDEEYDWRSSKAYAMLEVLVDDFGDTRGYQFLEEALNEVINTKTGADMKPFIRLVE